MFINKNIFLVSRVCSTKGWYYYRGIDDKKFSIGEQFRLEEGKQIGELARQIYCRGVLVEEKNVVDAATKTSVIINDVDAKVIFEATFINKKFSTRADILVRIENGWHLIEVKSCTEFYNKNKKEKEEYIDDIAYTLMVLDDAISINKISIMSLSKDFRLGMDLSKLFATTDVTDEVKVKKIEFDKISDAIVKEVTS